jgi:hypothetical protein
LFGLGKRKEVGNNGFMKYMALLSLFGAMSFAGQDGKPTCNAKLQGQFWPEQANWDREAARQLYQTGELEMCSMVIWKYRWEHISVNVRDLGKGRHTVASESRAASPTPKIEDAEAVK